MWAAESKRKAEKKHTFLSSLDTLDAMDNGLSHETTRTGNKRLDKNKQSTTTHRDRGRVSAFVQIRGSDSYGAGLCAAGPYAARDTDSSGHPQSQPNPQCPAELFTHTKTPHWYFSRVIKLYPFRMIPLLRDTPTWHPNAKQTSN